MDQQESDSTEILKEELWEKFSSYMNLNATVNRERFFAYLGIAFENVGYGKLKPVSKKGRRIAYTGLSFKDQEKLSKRKPDARDPAKSRTHTIEGCNVQQWMERTFCEGDKADFTAKKQIWMKFQKETQAKEDTKSIFFSLLGNTIFKNPPFLKVTGVKREGKVSHYQYLKERYSSTGKLMKIATHETDVSNYCQEDHVKVIADEGDRHCLPVKTDQEMVKSSHMPEKCVPYEIQSPAKNASTLDSSAEFGYGIASEPTSQGEEQQPSVDDTMLLTDDEEGEQVNAFDNIREEDLDTDTERKSQESDVGEDEEATDVSASSSSSVSSAKEVSKDEIFRKFHKKIDHLYPFHLPGRPSTFQEYLNCLFHDLSNFVVERASIHSSSAKALNYVDSRIRAFLAVTFPPIKVGSLAGTVIEMSFEGDIFPQFTHVAKGTYKCAICVPYLKWAILHNHPHSVTRSRKATIQTILEGTAELEFSGLVQLQEHSVSKCHMEACSFWKDREIEKSTEKPSSKNGGDKKKKTIDQYFRKPSNPLNW